ncbi:Stp1/IreP family PP2C-type Ser/Thr phosphatase [Aquibacillus albus]|uniref:Serine/threonine protein phosphatase PrpC n=1 Tax=Aquibacillus albus TaxID=1168171 RepID=A0ABS2N0V1_9BACI|nr:Stp1/IreP family PP2C-type Ser/Thr phosphatase [Aquibacillus albus]MBM7571775.1 serine/threonine protein phosphatase PrpC [Aquibacillus albus]
MNGYFLTDKGQVRDHNEDDGGVFLNQDKQMLALIADGMGGHNAGDIASKMVIQELSEKWKQTTTFDSPGEAESWLSESILHVNNDVYEYAQAHENCVGMGTTIVAVICSPDFITIGHIGDSRCYLFNNQGFNQITEDHSLVNELVRAGQISRDDAEYHPRKNVLLKALGTEKDVHADVQTIGWEKTDKLLLCSDGLSNKLAEEELQQFINSSQPIDETARELIELANERGGEDNISLALIHYHHTIEDSQKEGESTC